MHILTDIFKWLLLVILVLPVVKINERNYITAAETS